MRAALQAVVGCAGAAAGGSGDCGSAAAGAAASVVLNNLLSTGTSTATDKDGKPLTLEEQQARTNLVASLVAAIANAASADASAATTAAIIETENNANCAQGICTILGPAASPEEAKRKTDEFFASTRGMLEIAAYGSKEKALECAGNSNASGCAAGQARLIILAGDNRAANIDALAGNDAENRKAFDALNNDQLIALEETRRALAALTPEARAALSASLASAEPTGNNTLLSYLLSPTDRVNLAATFAQIDQSALGTTVRAIAAFDQAFREGVFDQAKDTVVGLAVLVGRTVQLGADSSSLGSAGDALRAAYGGKLPSYFEAVLPSQTRGAETREYLAALGSALSDYAQSRAADPEKFKADVLYVVNKYRDELGAQYDAVKDDPVKLAGFFGDISGRVAFEVATILLPTKLAKAAEAANAAAKAAETANGAGRVVDAVNGTGRVVDAGSGAGKAVTGTTPGSGAGNGAAGVAAGGAAGSGAIIPAIDAAEIDILVEKSRAAAQGSGGARGAADAPNPAQTDRPHVDPNDVHDVDAFPDGPGSSAVDKAVQAETKGPRIVSPPGFVEVDEFRRLNVPDPATGKLRPGEASAAVELQQVLGGRLERLGDAKGADFKFVSGSQAGKSVDFLLTPGTVKDAAEANRFFVKNADRFSNSLLMHLGKADIVPIDARFLTPQNQKVLMEIVGRQSKVNQSRIIIFR